MTAFPTKLLSTISQGDTLEMMANLPDECLDLIVTSPPYGVNKFYEQDKDGGRTPFWKTAWLWFQCFKHFQRLLKPGSYLVWQFGDNTFGKYVLGTEVHTTIPMTVLAWQIGQKVGLELQAVRIWCKRFASMSVPFICNIEPRPILDYEYIWTFRKPGVVPGWLGRYLQKVRDHKISRRGVWDTTKEGLEEFNEAPQPKMAAGHRASFPLAIPKWAITLYSDPGDVVMDNFMGTGTTAIAAEIMGRQWYGIERDPQWVGYAKTWLAQTRTEGIPLRMEIA